MFDTLAFVGALLLGLEVIEGMVIVVLVLYWPFCGLSTFVGRRFRVSEDHGPVEMWLRRLVRFFVILPLSWIIGLVAVPALLIFFISFLAWGIRKLDDLVDQVIAKLMDSELPGFISEDVVRRLSGFGLPISELLKNALPFLGPKFGRENRLLESIQRQQ